MPTGHATTLDIQAILIARRAALDAAVAAAHAAVQKPIPGIRTQSTPTKPSPVATPAPAPVAPVPAPVVSDADLTAFITKSIPVLQGAIQSIIKDHGLTGILSLVQVVSTLVRDGLPQAKGADARAIVIAVFSAAVTTFVTPALPVFVRPFVPGLIKAGIAALEAIYQASVKKRSA